MSDNSVNATRYEWSGKTKNSVARFQILLIKADVSRIKREQALFGLPRYRGVVCSDVILVKTRVTYSSGPVAVVGHKTLIRACGIARLGIDCLFSMPRLTR